MNFRNVNCFEQLVMLFSLLALPLFCYVADFEPPSTQIELELEKQAQERANPDPEDLETMA